MPIVKPARWILVTGATSGIGLATAVHLAERGHHVIASGRSEQKLSLLQQAAQVANVAIHPILLDVTNPASVTEARHTVLSLTAEYGLDALVNNAGYGESGALEEIPTDRLRHQFETNVIGLVSVTQAFLPEMRSRHSGRIINISSVLGKIATPLLAAYAASKHAVEALSDGMRMELHEAGIQVVIVAPGRIESQFNQTMTKTMETWLSPTSLYRHNYERFAKQRTMAGLNRSPLLIAEAVRDAVESAQPKARYAITVESKLLPAAAAFLPKRLLDYVMRKVMM